MLVRLVDRIVAEARNNRPDLAIPFTGKWMGFKLRCSTHTLRSALKGFAMLLPSMKCFL